MSSTLVPIFICVVLPIAIVLIVFIASINNDNKRAEVLLKAIECCYMDPDKLAEALQKPKKTAREILNLRLLRGCMFSFIGIALCTVGLVPFCTGLDVELMMISSIFGGASLAVGLSYIVVYLVTRKQIKD
ncbi:DUF6249 domain-containing protein [uncultured Duncaniella sp.]|uniref:DUF6249 domain-containing protein n=1 Tax=uncultured Duncaniella sp. TaxID=2768039 RepID=UPI00272AD4A7|nr:DUF6249 domain-containing protein [uncultured Duncaniella sp.]